MTESKSFTYADLFEAYRMGYMYGRADRADGKPYDDSPPHERKPTDYTVLPSSGPLANAHLPSSGATVPSS